MSAVLESGEEARTRAQIRARVAASGSSFYWAMRFLAPERRDAMFAIYAFCREVDDIADGDEPAAQKIAGLAGWRDELAAIFAGTPRLPLGRVLAADAARFHLRRADFLAVIDGMEMDAKQEIRAPSLAELDLYCDRVAGAVGRLSVRAFGVDSAAADEVAHSLGRALQLTNILRDLAEDAGRGRLYLPRELLAKHGIAVPIEAPMAVLRHPGLPAVCDEVAAMAEKHFVAARSAMMRCPRRAMRPAAVMRAVYHALLARLTARGWRDLADPVKLPAPIKLWLALRYSLL